MQLKQLAQQEATTRMAERLDRSVSGVVFEARNLTYRSVPEIKATALTVTLGRLDLPEKTFSKKAGRGAA